MLIITVAGALLWNPLFTMSCATNVPATSAIKVGFAVVAPESIAALPAGLLIRDHWKVSGRFWGSVPLPCSVTVLFSAAVWFGPALAVGASGVWVVIVTVAGALLSVPLLTINCAT